LKKLVFALVLATAGLGRASSIIDFNDLATPNNGAGIADWGVVPTSYATFMWAGWEVVDGASFDSAYTPIFSPPFPNKAVYNGGDGNLTVAISSGTPFNLIGADFSYWPGIGTPYEASIVTITGWLDDVQVGAPVVISLTDTFALASINLVNINLATFTSSDEGQYWLMDNMEVQTAPEPSSALLLLGGLLFLAYRCRIVR
jgi:hypothetical protein